MSWFTLPLILLITPVRFQLVSVQQGCACRYVAGLNHTMYIPFQGHTPAEVWTPHKDPISYKKYRDLYRNYFPQGAGRATAIKASKDILLSVALASSMQSGSYIPPSEAWHPIIKQSAPMQGRAVSAGLIFDYLFISIAKPSPSEDWYCRVLAARDTIFGHWISHPKSHSCPATLTLTLLCNIVGMLDLRLSSLLKTDPEHPRFSASSPKN